MVEENQAGDGAGQTEKGLKTSMLRNNPPPYSGNGSSIKLTTSTPLHQKRIEVYRNLTSEVKIVKGASDRLIEKEIRRDK